MKKTVIQMKPHHFLDVLRNFGIGKTKYEPSQNGNALYSIVPGLLSNRDTIFKFTSGIDDVCRPCKYHRQGKCANTVSAHGVYKSMNTYNRHLDEKIYEWLGLSEGQEMTASDYCRLVRNKINDIDGIWIEVPEEENKKRKEALLAGIAFYLGESR
ncbi:MAG: hypothetical protein A2297_10300 [Elusimicrobia bacterium RIFOXYB2_FULL_48_7]|nr:MAG: hypothetical protein A2297_10300 [Elusimicrobia bacterium RIFOXYB2_FULL_48_7]